MAAKVLAFCLLLLCAGQGGCVKRRLPLIPSSEKKRAQNAGPNLSGSASSSADPAAAAEPTLADWVGRKFLENKMSAKDFSETFSLRLWQFFYIFWWLHFLTATILEPHLDNDRMAVAAYKEGAKSVAGFARAGNWGAAPKNLARDFMAQALKGSSLPEIFYYPIPLWDPASRSQITCNHPFLLPHEMIHHLLRQDPDLAHVSAVKYPKISDILEEACTKEGLDNRFTAAVGLHGDGVPYTKKESVEILSFNFLSQPTADRILN